MTVLGRWKQRNSREATHLQLRAGSYKVPTAIAGSAGAKAPAFFFYHCEVFCNKTHQKNRNYAFKKHGGGYFYSVSTYFYIILSFPTCFDIFRRAWVLRYVSSTEAHGFILGISELYGLRILKLILFFILCVRKRTYLRRLFPMGEEGIA